MAGSPSVGDAVARLRLIDESATDWAFSAEGFLLLYDPAVVTNEVFKQLYGLQSVVPAALGWMAGYPTGGSPLVAEPEHWRAHSRPEAAARVARVVQLGWECSLVLLPMTVAQNGADVRFRSGPLSADEKKIHQAHHPRKQRGPLAEPYRGWLVTRRPRLGVTWDFMLGFTPAQKRKTFGPGYQVEIDWPAGAYQVKGWTFPPVEGDEGCVDQFVVQLEGWPAEPEAP
jgi:hypothetical protein